MYIRGLIFLFSLSLLGACSSVQPQLDDTQQTVLGTKLQRLLADYNTRHHSHVQMPALSIDDDTDQPAMIASANYSTWSISVNRLWLKKDPCIVYKEAMAHELAHLLVDYVQYGMPRAATLITRTGPVVVAFNGPQDLEDSSIEHGKDWQDMALELGAHPCEEGYCRSSHPYSKTPLTCSAADYALLHVTPPAPVKSTPGTAASAPATTRNFGVSSSRTIYDSRGG
ncbi:MAG TPA: hypothetical protein VGM47_10900 [Gammaproteobacteria bacterium]|jgi:hypothetical protein